jgi:hypothetical protein
VLAVTAVACESGHRFTFNNETDDEVVYVWDGVREGKLDAGARKQPGLLYKHGEGNEQVRQPFRLWTLEETLSANQYGRKSSSSFRIGPPASLRPKNAKSPLGEHSSGNSP